MTNGSTNVELLRPAGGPAGYRIAYLIPKPEGAWQLSATGDASEPGVEAIWMNGRDRTLGLAAMGTALTSKGDQQSVCNMRHSGDRAKVGYSLCNSTMTKEIRDLGVLLTPMYVITGKIGAYRADTEKLSAALAQTDLNSVWAVIDASADDLQRKQAAAIRREQDDLANWRASLQSGDETLCGPVVDTRDALVSIAIRGKGLVWQRRGEVQPPHSVSDAYTAVSYCQSL